MLISRPMRFTVFLLLVAARAEDFKVWTNLRSCGGPFEKLFSPSNDVDLDEGEYLQDVAFIPGLQGLEDAVSEAQRAGKRLRAYGSKYSLNNFAYNDEYLVDSGALNYCKIGIDDVDHVAPSYAASKDKLVFVQSGVRVKHLHLWLLEKANLALPTSCFPDGPRFVGATLTGSHGSMTQVGAMQDYVKAIHIVTPSGHYLIQKLTDSVVTEAYAFELGGATLISDDALFLAAVVSFGSFGLVHGMLIEVEPSYKLKYEARRYDYDDVKEVLSSLDVEPLDLASGPSLPDDFAVYIDPYNRNDQGFWVRSFTKVSVTEQARMLVSPEVAASSSTSTDRSAVNPFLLLKFTPVSRMSKPVKSLLFGILVNISLIIGLRNDDSGLTLYPHEWYFLEGGDLPSAPIGSAGYIESEIMVSSDDALEVTEILLDLFDNDAMATRIGLRYMAPTEATLGPTRHGPLNVSVAIVSFQFIPHTYQYYETIFATLEASGIPHTYHWGKRMPFTKEYVERAYGDFLTDWLAQRDRFLGEEGKEMFANQLMEDMGLHVA